MKIERFEDIKAWQEARVLAKMIYDAAKSNRRFGAEGFSRRSTREFTQFLVIANGSAAEVQSQLYVAFDQGYISQEKFDQLYCKSDEVARLTSGFIQYLPTKTNTQKTQRTQATQQTK